MLVQCRSYSKKTVNQLYNYSIVLGAAIKCKPYSDIAVEIGKNLKTVKITLSIFAVWNVKLKSIIIFIASDLKHWSWFNFTSIAERTCRDAKNLLWKIRSMTCRNVKNNWNWYFNLKSVFNSIDQIQFVILLKGNVDNAFFTSYVLSSSNVSQSFAHPDFAGVEKTQQKKQTVYSNQGVAAKASAVGFCLGCGLFGSYNSL